MKMSMAPRIKHCVSLLAIVVGLLSVLFSAQVVFASEQLNTTIDIDFESIANVPVELQPLVVQVLTESSNLPDDDLFYASYFSFFEQENQAMVVLVPAYVIDAGWENLTVDDIIEISLSRGGDGNWSIQEVEMGIRPLPNQPAASENYRFPWDNDKIWVRTQGFHPNTAVDFAPPWGETNTDVLSVSSGKLTITCEVQGQSQVTVTVGNFVYLHIERSSIPSNLVNKDISQGTFIGRLFDPNNGGGWNNMDCGWGTAPHLHLGFPSNYSGITMYDKITSQHVYASEIGNPYPVNRLFKSNNVRYEVPAEFSKISPSHRATDLDPNNVTISWNDYTGANFGRYRYCYYTDNPENCDSDGGDWTNARSNTSVTLPGLQSNTTYHWHVQAVLGDNTKVDSSGGHWQFTTAPGVPAAFSKIDPINYVIKTALPVTLTWGASSAGVTYYYCVDSLPSCTPSIPVGTATSVSWSPSPEPAGGIATYYWQVKAVNSQGTTFADGGADGSFIIDIKPGAFAKTGPASGTQASMTPTLSWGVSAKATSYEYCISETQNCSSSWVNVGNTNSKTLSTPLNASTTYYWQVRAKNSTITTEANGGTWWSFTTVPLPGAFGKTSPADAATDQILSPTLSWSASAGATGYEYCYSSASGPCTHWNPVGTNTSVTLSGLAADYTYYWQVRAINISGPTQANSGSWWSFTTTSASACTWPAYTPPTSATFGDVPMTAGHWSWVERLANSTITAGCGAGNYCPFSEVNSAQMASFLLRSKHCGSSYTPPAVGASTGFNNVPLDATYAPWVKQLAAEGITAGCGNGNFCPQTVVNRAQMAIFLLRAMHGSTYSPPAVGATTGFGDVPLDATYAAWVKQLAAEGVTAGCGDGNFCPLQNVNRAQLATFLVRAFKLP